MHRTTLHIAFAALAAHSLTGAGCQRSPTPELKLDYPSATRGDVVDDYNGTKVVDPYRWLENPDSPETRVWIEAQNKLTRSILDQVPEKEHLTTRLTELWNFERYTVPERHADSLLYFHNDGLQNQSVLYQLKAGDETPKLLLDPNLLSKDGTVSLAGTIVDKKMNYLAWGSSDGGSDWSTWHVRDLRTGLDLDDVLSWVKFSDPAWSQDGAGFFYARYPEPENPLEQVNLNHQLYYHKVGTPQAADLLVIAEPGHPKRGFDASVSDDGQHVFISVWEGTAEKNRLYVRQMSETGEFLPSAETWRLFDDFDAYYKPIGTVNGTLYLTSDLNAPRGKVISVDLNAKGETSLVEVVPEHTDTLREASLIGGKLVLTYLQDAHTAVRLFKLDGSLDHSVELPGIGSASGFEGSHKDTTTFYSYSSYTTPPTIYSYDVNTQTSELFKAPTLDFDDSQFVTEQVFYTSKDGTKIPMFIVHHKDLELNGANPTILYGYGGFNIPLTPRFKVAQLIWLEMGGVYAVANLRGGGEYGRSWHLAGTLANKQNVFDDFFAAAEWLIHEGYTRPDKLAINGGSNGGLLVGAAITQRPELFGAAIPQVGVLDMLRYHLFTIGWAWASDYGRSDDPEMFPSLLAYSPLHNIKSGIEYPPTLIMTGDHDDRVVPAHSFKFAAELQHQQTGPNPTLIRIETRAGHGAGKPTEMQIEEVVDKFSFLITSLSMTVDSK